ncbi:hypothetical protein FACS1894123_05170 [Bacteroidia bacterium]|nr:hypothetical protein FACS1894123_05170 [Bacteroidia bacterium]
MAKQVSEDKALHVAQQIMGNQLKLRNSSFLLQLIYKAPAGNSGLRSFSRNDKVLYYVYNVGQNAGFVIVAGDDLVYPVIGYATSGMYDPDNLPPNFQVWMENVEYGLNEAIEKEVWPSESTAKAWNYYLSGNQTDLRTLQSSVGPLLRTQWGQDVPYNDLCPTYNRTEKSVSGCVATTMAQIMKYHRYPDAGTGNTDLYISKTINQVMKSVNLDNYSYNWDIMLNRYLGNSTKEARDEIAKLMYHCGLSVQMDYGRTSSASVYDAGAALMKYFKYDKGLQLFTRSYYSNEDWKNIIYKELDAGRPIFYSGLSTEGGHAFVCDGYDSAGLFHFNWGWDGQLDGYFTIDNITYKYDNDAIVGIQPEAGGSAEPVIALLGGYDFKATSEKVLQNGTFYAYARFINIGLIPFSGYYGVILTDQYDRFVSKVGSLSESTLVNPGYYMNKEFSFYCKIPTTVPDGNYKIHAAYSRDGINWTIAKARNGSIGNLSLMVGKGAGINRIQASPVKVYRDGQTIIVDSPAGEKIEIYSVIGNLILRTNKQAGTERIDIQLPVKQILIVKGSSGWIKKILI